MKNIWILNHYATSMLYERGGRHYSFAKYLAKDGFNPVIFCASTLHNQQQQVDLDGALYAEKNSDIGATFVFIKAREYVGNGKARVLNMLDFYRNVKTTCKQYAKNNNLKPDVIYASSVHPLTLVAGIKLAKHFGIKCVCEVRDLWPESLAAYGMAGRHNPLIWLLYHLERWIYAKADALIFTMEGGRDYIIEKGWDAAHGGPVDLNKVYHINNGVDLEAFDYNREHFTVEDPDLDNPNTFKVIYTGSIRRVNELDKLVYAAEVLRDRRGIIFLLYGEGTDREELETYCKEHALPNVRFKGRVEKKYIPYILSKSSLNVLNYAPNPILRYGWSMNKLFDYLASGKPVLINFDMQYSLFDQYPCGFARAFPTPKAYAEQIAAFTQLPEEQYTHMCEQARLAAQEYDFKRLTDKLVGILENG